MKPIRSARPALALLLTLAACADGTAPAGSASAGAAPLLSAAPGRGVEGQYIVVLNEGADGRSVA
ncbi:MAG TPA: hypothetical protein VFY65_02310, partial [Longimicrobium sp.]|nr:hypothetical protein [Longimicrobium sp.]